MVGITLSPEQIQQAPPEVRRWIEQQIASALGLTRPAPSVEAPARHLVGCDLDQARAVLSLIHGMLPVVTVFFELAQEPIGVTNQGLHVLRLDEMQRHCRLQAPNQVIACLGAIDEALQRASGSADVALTMVDRAGHCLVASETAQSVLALWQELVTAREAVHPVAPPASMPQTGPAAVSPMLDGISVPVSPVDAPQQPGAVA